jgi:WXG100 family type VII secretion target
MDTDVVLDLSYQVSRAAAEIQQEVQTLSQSIFTLSSVWQGSSRDIFLAEIQQTLRGLANLSDDATTLSRLLQQEVDEWETAAATFGERGSPIWSPIGDQPRLSPYWKEGLE